MKHFISLVLAGVMTAVSVTFSSPTVTAETEHHDNVLITYFSRAGENYNVGVVERGNTDLLAEIVAEETGGELFRIETVKEYPSAYDEMLTVATEERRWIREAQRLMYTPQLLQNAKRSHSELSQTC